jgi:hypothetical protein
MRKELVKKGKHKVDWLGALGHDSVIDGNKLAVWFNDRAELILESNISKLICLQSSHHETT